MTTAALVFRGVRKNLRSKVNSIDLPIINWKAVCIFGFFAAMALLVFYVWQINSLTEGYYLISGYEKQVNELAGEKQELEISFAENSFLGEALVKIQALNFQKATSIKYIQIPANSVAVVQKGDIR